MFRSDAQLLTGDCIEHLERQGAACIDAIVTDPPYELGFMDYGWDSTGIAYSLALWRACLRVLKPGGHLLAFGSPRTYHRMACAIEDSGFEIRDSIHWIYGSGFPHGTDISKAVDRRRNDREAALRVTAHIRAARQKARMSNADIDAHFGTRGMASHWTSRGSQPAVPNCEQWARLKALLQLGPEMDNEVARLNERKQKAGDSWTDTAAADSYKKVAPYEEWRVRLGKPNAKCNLGPRYAGPASDDARRWQGWNTALKPAHEPVIVARRPCEGTTTANVLRHSTGALNVGACRIRSDGERDDGRWPSNVVLGDTAADALELHAPGTARFFYVAKASQVERNAGLDEHHPVRPIATYGTIQNARSASGEPYAPSLTRNHHPTVKPLALMRHLVRLVTPPGGIVLDPFMGSGTTGIAAVLEGAGFIGIEREPEYVAIATSRIAHWRSAAHAPAA